VTFVPCLTETIYCVNDRPLGIFEIYFEGTCLEVLEVSSLATFFGLFLGMAWVNDGWMD